MPTSWLPKLILVSDFNNDWSKHDAAVYARFQQDLIHYHPTFQLKRFSINKKVMLEGREKIFWHIVTEGPVETNRTIDPRRCERIGWIRPLVEEYPKTQLKIWASIRSHGGKEKEKRYLLAPTDFSYIVVLADKGTFALLITAFAVEHENRRKSFEKDFSEWNKAGDAL